MGYRSQVVMVMDERVETAFKEACSEVVAAGSAHFDFPFYEDVTERRQEGGDVLLAWDCVKAYDLDLILPIFRAKLDVIAPELGEDYPEALFLLLRLGEESGDEDTFGERHDSAFEVGIVRSIQY